MCFVVTKTILGRVVATTFQVDGFRDRVGAEKLLRSNQDHSCFNIRHSYPFSGLAGGYYVITQWAVYSPFNSELLSVAMLCYHTVRWVQPINAELLSVAMLCYHTVRWVQPIQFWAVVCGHAMGRPLQEKTLWAYSQLGLEVKMVLLRHHDSQTIIIKRWQRNRWHCYQRKKKKEEKEKKRKKLLGDQAKK